MPSNSTNQLFKHFTFCNKFDLKLLLHRIKYNFQTFCLIFKQFLADNELNDFYGFWKVWVPLYVQIMNRKVFRLKQDHIVKKNFKIPKFSHSFIFLRMSPQEI